MRDVTNEPLEVRVDRVVLRGQVRSLKQELRRLHAIRREYGEPADLHAQVQALRGAVSLAADALAMVTAAASDVSVAGHDGDAIMAQHVEDLDASARAASVVERSIRATLAKTPSGQSAQEKE